MASVATNGTTNVATNVATNRSPNISYPLDFFYRFKSANNNLPQELISFIEKNQSNKSSQPSTWRKSKLETNWLINNKLNQTNNDKIYASMKEILNKLNKDNFDKLSSDIQNINITTKEQLEELSNLILNKAISEQIYSNLYAKLCYNLLATYVEEDKRYYFRDYLLNKCQQLFIHYSSKPETDESTIPKMNVIGCMKFIGELYNVKIISDKIMNSCFDSLVKKLPNINTKCIYNIDSICIMLITSGKAYLRYDKKNAKEYILNIKKIIDSVNGNMMEYNVTKREVFMFMDMLDKLNTS